MSDLYQEHLVKKERTAADSAVRIAVIGFTALFVVAGLFITPFALLLALVLGLAGYFILFPRTDLEYEYLYVNGELDIDKIMSKVKRKRVGSFDISKAEMVAPVKSHELDYYRQSKDLKVVDCSSGEDHANVYGMVIKDEKGMKLVLFEPNQEILDDMRRIAPRKVKFS